ncbi:hypothetical protein U5B43_09700, partial [Campylobacter sp. 9BO]|uniref:hypothetical protein n=1 Tax=Campylobacter sp. 9BO TaxID=3424759 RepID=UPI003D328EDD
VAKITAMVYEDNIESIVSDRGQKSVVESLSPKNIKVNIKSNNLGFDVELTNDAKPKLIFDVENAEGKNGILHGNGGTMFGTVKDGKLVFDLDTQDTLKLTETNSKLTLKIEGVEKTIDVNLDATPDTLKINNLDTTPKNGKYSIIVNGNVSDEESGNSVNIAKSVKIVDLETAKETSYNLSDNKFTADLQINLSKNYLVQHEDAAGNITRETIEFIKNSGLDVNMYFYNCTDADFLKLPGVTSKYTKDLGVCALIQDGDNVAKWISTHEQSATATATKLNFSKTDQRFSNGKYDGVLQVDKIKDFMPNNYTLNEAQPRGSDVIVNMDGYLYMEAGKYKFKLSGYDNKATVTVDGVNVVNSGAYQNIEGDTLDNQGRDIEGKEIVINKAGFYKIGVNYVDLNQGHMALKVEVSKNNGAYKVVGDDSSGTRLYSNSYVKALNQSNVIENAKKISSVIKLPLDADIGEKVSYMENGTKKSYILTTEDIQAGNIRINSANISNVTLENNIYVDVGSGLTGHEIRRYKSAKLHKGFEKITNILELSTNGGKQIVEIDTNHPETSGNIKGVNWSITTSGGWYINSSYEMSVKYVKKTTQDISLDNDVTHKESYEVKSGIDLTKYDLIQLKQDENSIKGSDSDDSFVYDASKIIDASGGTDKLIIMDSIDFTKIADLDKKLNSFEKIQLGSDGASGSVKVTFNAETVSDMIDSAVTDKNSIKALNTILQIDGDSDDVLNLKGFNKLTDQATLDNIKTKHSTVGDKNSIDMTNYDVYSGVNKAGETVYIEVDKEIKVNTEL